MGASATRMTESKWSEGIKRLQAFRHEHKKAEIVGFFTAGFLFDVIAVSRIDDALMLVQQGLYLVVLAILLILDERYRAGIAAPPRALRGVWRFAEDAMHFFLGTLLNQFMLLYLKSSSGLAPFLFMAILCALLVANELPGLREKGPVVRVALFGLCATSYFAILLPILLGFISRWLFVSAIVLSCAALAWLLRRLCVRAEEAQVMRLQLGGPAFGVQALLVVAYFAGTIPPVPLSLQFIGIYHQVVPPGMQDASAAAGGATSRTYLLKHERPWWKPWQHGDQDFAARPGDVVYCFARVFAPRGFHDAVFAHWWMRGAGGWLDQGRAQLDISGGREEGFRAFATKRNYQPGRWRVAIETADGRGIGAIQFRLTNDASSEDRSFKVDRL
jgi:Protein of unknown function (DUF2914)